MIDVDKVIKGLECCTRDIRSQDDNPCNGCPYDVNYQNNDSTCTLDLKKDALALLKAQEPRLLGLDEIKMLGLMWHESHNGFVQPVICQNYEYGVDRSVEFIMVHGTICNSINTFGKLWRVWTSKPTDAQREAKPWT